MTWIHKGGIFCLFLMVGTVSGMEPGPSSISLPTNTSSSQLSTLGSQLVRIQEQVEVLQQENMEDKQRIVHLERRVSLLESVCGSSEMETEISGPLMAIGGYNGSHQRSAEVLNTSCDFPLPDTRTGHISVTTADGKTLVCGGGTTSYRFPEINKSCLQFDYKSKSWKEHSTLLSGYRKGSSAVTLSRGTYIIGGMADANRISSEFLATGSSVWTQGPHNFSGEFGYTACAAKLSDTEFVILAGAALYSYQALVYNEEQDAWRRLLRLKVPIGGQSCVALGDKVIMAGGSSPVTMILDTKTGSAREVASLKYPRFGAAMVLYRGRPLILGGKDESGEYRSDGEMWNMDTETWEEADIHLNIARWQFSLVTMAKDIDCN